MSFQVIEHLHDIPGYLRSLRRVTRPGGEVWIATPNRLTFTPGSDTPVNPFHTREFTAAELVEECERAGFRCRGSSASGTDAGCGAIERLTRRTFVDLVTATPPEDWPRWLRRRRAPRRRVLVHRGARHRRPPTARATSTATLDLLAVCRVPAA